MNKSFYLNIKLSIFVLAGIFISCENEIEEQYAEVAQEMDTEMAYPHQKGKFERISFYGSEVIAENINDTYILEGDIVIAPNQIQVSKEEIKSNGRINLLWPNNIVFFEIDSNLDNQERITDAIAHWEVNTHIRFVQRTNQVDYVRFQSGSGCSSNLGRIGGEQIITIGDVCTTGNTIHEIGHAVGLLHEQGREDRDQFITVNFDNMDLESQPYFETWRQRGFVATDLTPFDLGSIMMYASYAFSNNGEPTITRNDGSVYTTNREVLSANDIAGVDVLYPADNASVWWFSETEGAPVFYLEGDIIYEMTGGNIDYEFEIVYPIFSKVIIAREPGRNLLMAFPKTDSGDYNPIFWYDDTNSKWNTWLEYTYVEN
ncbi:M12 family metallopeptidase [Aquimarina pacifica]|uniref:M12 family metallopeptidase n=1 Tax=Aquimarina pacifica TaxID=1296415 RepID=UPI00046F73E3|nr:M12 family metallopeptidase [Aquimarina pacifica]